MVEQEGPNAEERRYWSASTGQAWIDNETGLDALFSGITSVVLDRLGIDAGDRVLDVGCGTGAHALAAAERVGQGGEVVALDISPILLERARARSTRLGLPVRTRLADAQTDDLGSGTFDFATSRFGVMFFSEPAAAFANIACAVRPGGRMIFAVWAAAAENPWWAVPARVAEARLCPLPPTEANAPGPMGLADRTYVVRVLRDAGFRDADVIPVDLDMHHPGDADSLAELALRIGPAARAMRLFEGSDGDARVIASGLAQAFQPWAGPGGVTLPARLNLIDVRLP